jgi:hypothetical protein
VALRDIFRRKSEHEVAAPPEPKRDHAFAKRHQTFGFTAPHVDFYLYLRTREDADAAREALHGEGYAVHAAPSADPESDRPWLVRASGQFVAGEQSMDEAEAFFRQLAERFDGEYDGWERAGA